MRPTPKLDEAVYFLASIFKDRAFISCWEIRRLARKQEITWDTLVKARKFLSLLPHARILCCEHSRGWVKTQYSTDEAIRELMAKHRKESRKIDSLLN